MPSNIIVPELGESIVDARVAKWLKKEGDRVAAGDPLVELETDKIDVEVGAPQAGVLAKIERREGTDVKIGEVLGVVHAAGVEPSGLKSDTPGLKSGPTYESVVGPNFSSATPGPGPAAAAPATPSARKLARQHEVDLSLVPGTGDGGRVTRGDVEGAVAAQAAPTVPGLKSDAPGLKPGPTYEKEPLVAGPNFSSAVPATRREERVRMSRRRLTIAKRLVEAQHTAAMLTTFNEVDMSGVMQLRERRKKAFKERYGVNIGVASFFVKACVGALKDFPRLNAEIQGDEMILKHYYDIGVAVGAPEGLVVPVLRHAERMSFPEIELAIRDCAKKAGDGTLTLEDLRGGTFTVTNGGVFGSLLSTPILNPPQVGILGLHKIEDRPIAIGGQVAVRPMMYLALSYDHRIVDGAEAVRFLVRVKELVEDPAALLLEV
jgi:2-oxoglutarate dehydrogenase E2 component (dihydrolipoamide succinyltransferase)